MQIPFRNFNSFAEIIRLTMMIHNRYPLSLRQVADLLFERGIDICHKTVCLWWPRFGPMSGMGHKRKSRAVAGMSALGGIAGEIADREYQLEDLTNKGPLRKRKS
jgi:transposase-like protein